MPDDTTTEQEAVEEPMPEQQAHEDRRLVDQCLAGKEGAWDRLYDQYQEALLGMIRSLVGPSTPAELADEIAARVWYSLVQDDGRRLDRFDPVLGRPLASYLAALVRREVSHYFRSERRRRAREQRVGEAARRDSTNDSANTHVLMDEFTRTLTPKEREFLETDLLGSVPDDGRPPLSDANKWQLSYRVRRKLNSFLEGGRDNPRAT